MMGQKIAKKRVSGKDGKKVYPYLTGWVKKV